MKLSIVLAAAAIYMGLVGLGMLTFAFVFAFRGARSVRD
jgi:hypothetical protein